MIRKGTGHIFTSIADAVRVPTSVKVLDLTRSDDLRCRNVVCEKFDEPCICRISRVLERLGHLEILSLAGNQLPSLPPGLFTLKRLQLVDLSDNCLTELQPDIAALQELQVLHLQGNPQLEDLPRAAVRSLPALRSLQVDQTLAESLKRRDPSGFFSAAVASAGRTESAGE